LVLLGCNVSESPPSESGEVETVSSALTNASVQIDCGGAAHSPYISDADFNGGTTINHANTIDTSAAHNPAPVAVYQTGRSGTFNYTIPGYTSGSSHVIRLHFAETYFSSAGSRVFNVAINGTTVLSKFDIFAAAGGKNKAIIEQFQAVANSTGAYVIQFTSVTNQSLVSGIEIQGQTCTGANLTNPEMFLVVTSQALVSAVQPLATHKNATGISTEVATVECLETTYAGRDAPEKIKRKIYDSYLNKGTRYVLLAGDGSQVPVRFRFVGNPSTPPPAAGDSFNMSDLYYANLFRNHDAYGNSTHQFEDWDFNGNGYFNEEYWGDAQGANRNPDQVDGYPDIALGRIPASSSNDMTTYVNKVLRYEGWQQKSLSQTATGFFADCNYTADSITFDTRIEGGMRSTSGDDHVVLDYSQAGCGALSAPWASGPDQSIINDTNSKASIIYVGHGYFNTWLPNGSNWSPPTNLANTTNYPFVAGIACETGEFAPNLDFSVGAPTPYLSAQWTTYGDADGEGPWLGSSMATPWLFQTNGAIAYAGESLVGPDNWGADLMEYFTHFQASGTHLLGQAWRKAQIWYLNNENSSGDLIGAPRLYLGVMTLFGDPTLRLQYSAGGYRGVIGLNGSSIQAEPLSTACGQGGSGCQVASVGTFNPNNVLTLSGDVNGDGLTDLIKYDSSEFTVETQAVSGSFSAATTWYPSPIFGANILVVGDVNGDGNADIIAWGSSTINVMLSNGTSFAAPQTWSSAPAYGDLNNFPADVNGDGFVDLVAWNSNSIQVMLSNGGGGFSLPQTWSSVAFYGNASNVTADINGDGMTDLVAWSGGYTWVLLSSGSGFSTPIAWSNTPFSGEVANIVLDVNNDGVDDLVAVNNTGASVMLSTGTQFSAPVAYSKNAFPGTIPGRFATAVP
jgi:hypothetical protein